MKTNLRELRRQWRFRVKAFWQAVSAWQLWLDQRRCPHTFRPAKIASSVGRICSICEKVEPLNREDFFAYFGEIGGFNGN